MLNKDFKADEGTPNLYFISVRDEPFMDCDLMVIAHAVEDAIAFWLGYYELSATELVRTNVDVTIHEVTRDLNIPGAITWHSEYCKNLGAQPIDRWVSDWSNKLSSAAVRRAS